ncbi:MAG TPA: hypothetical protein VL651_17545 [Bacteroidia bacterium]|jgi:hypothetical protein|nr:hypothetical protein [Bacteroidia bacterium]
MKIYATQLKKSIREKLDAINDTEYLASLDAVLTYETISSDGKLPQVKKGNYSPLMKFFSLFRK